MRSAMVKTNSVSEKNGPKGRPSLFEVEYLRELKNELEIFLKSKNFNTIEEVQIAFVGRDYTGLMQVKA